EIVIQIFRLDAPIRREQPFGAAACRPADARIGKAAERAIMVGQGWSAFHDLRDTGARSRLTISQTAGPVEQKSRRDGKAHPAAHGAEVIEAPPGKQVLINRHAWETGDRCLAKHEGSAVAGGHALEVRLEAQDPSVGELPIVADLSTANEAINFRGDVA